MFVYVGTFNTPGKAVGVSVFRLDAATGALDHVQTVPGLFSPSFVALHPSRPLLYAVERQWTEEDKDTGAVASFSINEADGTLTLLNRVPSQGTSPCYVSVHPAGSAVFAAHYASGHVSAFPIQEGGTVGNATSVIHHQGVGPSLRQSGPHAHSIIPDPAGRYVLSCDLGIDKVMVYRFGTGGAATHGNSGSNGPQLIPNEVPYGQVASGEGPRHIAFHPSGRFVYVINEIGSSVSAFAFDAQRGTLTHRNTASTLPEDYSGSSACAQIIVHPNGRFVYGSNRGHDSIAIFAINQETGRITPRGHASTLGKTPRNFNINPSGTLLLAANQDSDTIVAFAIDQETGALTPTGAVTNTANAVCIVFRP